MKYDIYKGTEEDLAVCGGELFLVGLSGRQVREFCQRQEIDAKDFLDGSLLNGFWVEEAF